MALAWLLTLFALGGVSAGVFVGKSRMLSPRLAAGGAGLLFGISLFWLLPEIAETAGWIRSGVLVALAFAGLMGLDRFLHERGHSSLHELVGPLLGAAALHSFLDGWSVRVLALDPLAGVAAPIGLALHKIPEGLALGLVARRSFPSRGKAFLAGALVEGLTVVGALVEPRADRLGAAKFGVWWTAIVLSVIAGSFLFLGMHTVVPGRHKPGVVLTFTATLLAVAAGALVHRRLGGLG